MLYRHMQGSAAGQMGQRSGTLEDGLDDVDTLATEYEKFTFCTHVDFTKSTWSLVPAPFPRLR